MEPTEIQRFYKDSTVFLTGATGFIGKLLLEKILRALEVKKVFILVRAKKDVPAKQRAIFDSPIFDILKRTNNEVFDKVVIIEGDCALPMVGLSKEDQQTVIDEVDVFLHCAATVRFDEHLKKATLVNVRASKDLVDLAKKVQRLKTFVYVGTAYANSNRTEIKEQIYPSKISAENLIAACESLDEDCMQVMTKTLIADWPNAYTFTKQVIEDYINREAKNIPICICRPSIVISTDSEPVSAYVDTVYTLAGFVLANGLGICRIGYYKNVNLDMVPADYVVNQCIAAGWQTGETFVKQRSEIPVYHLSSALDNPISQDECYGLCEYYGRPEPPLKLVAYPLYFRTTCKYNYLILRFFLHTAMAFFMDLIMKVQGKPPIFMAGVKKLHTFQEAYEYFTITSIFMHTENANKLVKNMSFKDRELFNCDIRTLNWDSYFPKYCRGLRYYILKETLDTLPEGKKKYIYLRRVMTVSLIFGAILIYALGKIFLFRVLPLGAGMISSLLRDNLC